MEIVLIILLTLLIILVTVFGILNLTKSNSNHDLEQSINQNTQNTLKTFGETIAKNQQSIGNMQTNKFREFDIIIKDLYDTMEQRLDSLNKSLGEVHSLAGGIDDLKKVMSNVKTRGILGEMQLGAILEEMLAPSQYETNIATIPQSSNRVEFAIKLPGNEQGFVYLPIDSKFPLDAYMDLQEAKEANDTDRVVLLQKALIQRIKAFAKDIHTKYVAPPYTTDFAIMFLPFESLYLEAINLGLSEALQREYKINIAGPSTFAAMLNALQMGFKTLALKERTATVWETLINVKDEFDKFADVLNTAQQRINQTNTELDKLIGTRTRAIQKALRDIEKP